MSTGFTEQEFGPALPPPSPDSTTNGHANGHAAAPDTDPWPTLAAEAYHGLAGEAVARMLPHTESDPVALLLQFLVYFGNSVGRGPYYQVNRDKHFTNLYAIMAGASAKARKGLAAGLIRAVFEKADPNWLHHCVTGGMSSGEGVLHAIRDPISATKKGVMQIIDDGVADKRLLLDEREFFAALAVMKREGNIVSRIVRDAWDCPPVLRTLTKNTQTRVTNPFISIVGHITIEELRQSLDHTSMANGYANRFLFACVKRSKELPFGADVPEMDELGIRSQGVVETARVIERVDLNDSAKQLWREVYPRLTEQRPGLLSAITARAEAQTIRLALIYALQDGAIEIDRAHLEAALAVWTFCDASARHIFGELLGDTIADAILPALQRAGAAGMSRTALHGLFGGHRSGNGIGRALELLLKAGKARCEPRALRKPETWFAI